MDKILVTRSSMPDLQEYIDEIKELWDTHWLTNMGVKHKKLQEDLKKYLGVNHIDLMVNGHMALELTLQAMGLKGEVITTPFTFASTTHAIVRNGLTPVFCDINPYDFTIDVSKIESLISDKTCAILPVHVYGNICDVEGIQKIADKYGLKVIYDAAHAFGESYKGVKVGNFGDASIFSFHATKVYNTIEGGAVCYRDEKLGEKLYDLKNFGIHGEGSVNAVGANAKMNEFSAAMGICNLRHIDNEIAKRKHVYERYIESLEEIGGISLNYVEEDTVSNYAYFPVLFDEKLFGGNRDDAYARLASHGIYARKYFYPLTSKFECYNSYYDRFPTPVAQDISNKVLTLPIFADLGDFDLETICSYIKNFQ